MADEAPKTDVIVRGEIIIPTTIDGRTLITLKPEFTSSPVDQIDTIAQRTPEGELVVLVKQYWYPTPAEKEADPALPDFISGEYVSVETAGQTLYFVRDMATGPNAYRAHEFLKNGAWQPIQDEALRQQIDLALDRAEIINHTEGDIVNMSPAEAGALASLARAAFGPEEDKEVLTP